MIYWNEYHAPTIIEGAYEETETSTNNTIEWYNFSIKKIKEQYANNTKLPPHIQQLYSEAFAYYMSLYMSDTGIKTAMVNKYFTINLDKMIESIYNEALTKDTDETRQKQIFWQETMTKFQTDEIRNTERKMFFHHIKTAKVVKEYFQDKNVRETIIGIIDEKIEKPHISVGYDKSTVVTFNLSISEEEMWNSLSDAGESDKFRVLLF